MPPAAAAAAVSRESGRKGGRDKNDPDTEAAGVAATLAGLTRMLVFSLKGTLKNGILKTVLRKKAFMAIGERTAPAAILSEHLVVSNKDNRKAGVTRQSSFQTKALGFVKNGILGIAVFGVYDILIFHTWPSWKNESDSNLKKHSPVLTSDLKLVWMHASVGPTGAGTPLYAHFVAGALSGVAQSVIMDVWELTSHWWYHHRDQFGSAQHLNGINFHSIFRRLVHHSLGYASLFGVYETTRRKMFSEFYDYISSGHPSVPQTLGLLENCNLITKDSDNCYNMTFVPLTTSFLAGGLAGQLHYIISHYTRHWQLLSLHGKNQASEDKQKHSRRHWPKFPKLRPTAAAFIPTALCFVAFQYGGELTQKIIDEDDARHPFPVYIQNPN